MGLVYSLSSYFYPPKNTLSATAIKTQAQLLTLRLKQIEYKLQQVTIQQQQDLLHLITHNQHIRNKQAEKVRMQLIIRNSQQLLVYDDVILALNKIIVESYALENNPNSISNECIVAINSLVFVYEKLELKEFVNLNQFIPQPHPSVSIDKTAPAIQKYINQKPISHYQFNLYACQLAARHNISLQVFNSLGHQFEVNPTEPEEQSPSAHMFAMTLEDVDIQEEK